MADRTEPGPFIETVPDGDNRTRKVCRDCGHIQYDNPKIVVGAVCTWEDKILLCSRAIPPRIGYWTIPAGFMEVEETSAEGAAREVWEEAGARVEIGRLIGIYEIPRISHLYMIYAATLVAPEFAPGSESLETALFTWDRIPWERLAFPSITWALKRFADPSSPLVHSARNDDWID